MDEIARFHRDPAEWDRPVLDAGTRLGDYELRQLLGRGSYGDVYLAWDRRLEREVAIKLIDDALARRLAWAPRYLEEARLARVKSAQVVSIHQADVLTLPNGHVAAMLVMEHIRGETSSIGRVRMVAWGRARWWCSGSSCAAPPPRCAVGLVHRDIKPQNVMRAEGGRIVLMDFGPTAVRRSPCRLSRFVHPAHTTPPRPTICTRSACCSSTSRAGAIRSRAPRWARSRRPTRRADALASPT
ncbi:MAG: hypothetical protein U0527_12485 [Candidatus Eisenbacteria bacterium]